MAKKLNMFSKAFVKNPVSASPPASENKWNPGIYLSLMTTNNIDTNFNSMLTRVQNNPNIKGVMPRYDWRMLETTLGNYSVGFNKVDSHLASIRAYPGRRYMLFIQLKTFGGSTPSVPAYMSGASYNDASFMPDGGVGNDGLAYTVNGEYSYPSNNGAAGGYLPAMYMPAVRDRLIALLTAYGNRYNGVEEFEGICFTELSISRPRNVTAPWSGQSIWMDEYYNAYAGFTPAWPNTQICQWINAPRSEMDTLVPALVALGNVGVGMPDLGPDEREYNYNPTDNPGAAPGNIWHCQQTQGLGMVLGQASKEAMTKTVISPGQLDLPGDNFPSFDAAPHQTRQQIQAFAKNEVGVTHLLYGHSTIQDPFYTGFTYNQKTDEFLNDVGSDLNTITTRPTGW